LLDAGLPCLIRLYVEITNVYSPACLIVNVMGHNCIVPQF